MIEESSSSEDEDNYVRTMMETNLLMAQAAAAAAMVAADADDDHELEWGGSEKGKRRNKVRDFVGAHNCLVQQYFIGEPSTYDEEDFERRFRMPRHLFKTVWDRIHGKPPFVQYYDRCTKEPGISPLVRFVACLRKLCYGDPSDRTGEQYDISESALDQSFHSFCKLIKAEFAAQFLHRQPTVDELERIFSINKLRGFPGLFALWDCKHFVWKRCPSAFAGMHKGAKSSNNTIVLEAICDPDLYIWFSFFGSPGSLNDINILDKSSIVARMVDGSFQLRLPENLHYTVNGTTRNYLYFLVDGIYPPWSVFVSTFAHPDPQSKQAVFAQAQEAVRKDIERAFGVLVMRFSILEKAFMVWDADKLADIVDTCIILHNMLVVEHRSGFVSDSLFRLAMAEGEEEDGEEEGNPVMLFVVAEPAEAPDDDQNNFALQVATALADLRDVNEHTNLLHDLVEHNWNRNS